MGSFCGWMDLIRVLGLQRDLLHRNRGHLQDLPHQLKLQENLEVGLVQENPLPQDPTPQDQDLQYDHSDYCDHVGIHLRLGEEALDHPRQIMIEMKECRKCQCHLSGAATAI